METKRRVLIEACVDAVESAIQAQRGGAQRVELCDNLYAGGTTPSAGSIELARRHLDIELNVMIRPRGADFLYSDLELEIMKSDVLRAKDLGCDGVVFGILGPEGTVDKKRSREIVELAAPMSTTFHRAFDMTADPFDALEDLVKLGVGRVLTSGQRPSALAGVELLTRLDARASGRIIIMPGVGIDHTNIADLIRKTGAPEFHVLCDKVVASKMRYRNERVFMGTTPAAPEYERTIIDVEGIRSICEAAATAFAERTISKCVSA